MQSRQGRSRVPDRQRFGRFRLSERSSQGRGYACGGLTPGNGAGSEWASVTNHPCLIRGMRAAPEQATRPCAARGQHYGLWVMLHLPAIYFRSGGHPFECRG